MDQSVRSAISTTVDEFVHEDKMFTAWEITRAVREKGHRLKHDEAKPEIHNLLKPYVDQGIYLMALRDVGAPVQAFVYYPDGTDVSQYKPVDRNPPAAPQQRFDFLGGLTPTPAARQKGQEPDGRGRICVPANLLRSAGLNVGDTAHVSVDGNKLVVRATASQDSHEYVVDKDNNIRVSSSIVESAGLKDKDYEFSGDTQQVVVSPAA